MMVGRWLAREEGVYVNPLSGEPINGWLDAQDDCYMCCGGMFKLGLQPHMLHVWYIYLHLGDF